MNNSLFESEIFDFTKIFFCSERERALWSQWQPTATFLLVFFLGAAWIMPQTVL